MRIGTISEIWRYPVKSMGGERIDVAEVTAKGIAGDRAWAVRDTHAGEIVGAKRIPALLGCIARSTGEMTAEGVTVVEITLPDGRMLSSNDLEEVNAELSEVCKRPVTLEPLRPAEDLEFYRHGKRDAEHPAPSLQQIMGLEPGDPLPDFSGLPRALAQFATPPGTFFDAYALHLITTVSLAEVAQLEPAARFDVRRFRPNAVIETGADTKGFDEFEWGGRQLDAGTVGIEVVAPCVRCSMVMAEQPGLERDRLALRTLVEHTGQDFGIYCNVAATGQMRVGDAVTLGDTIVATAAAR